MQHSKTKVLPTEQEPTLAPHLARNLIWAAVLLLAIWAGSKAWRIGQAIQSLQSYQSDAEQMMATGITTIDPEEAEMMLLGIRQNILSIKQEVNFLMPITPYLGWIPKIGPTLVTAAPLLEMADAGTETAAFAIRGLKPALTILQSEASTGEERVPALIEVVDAAKPDLLQAGRSLEKVIDARTAINNEAAQPWRVQTLLQLADEWLPIAQDGLKLSLVLPKMMGMDGRRNYLIMAQNEDEIRPTGGFITGGGVVVVENGRILALDFQDSYGIDDLTKPYEFPPEQFNNLMGYELFLFRDTNFWPDFPTSAEVAMDSYSYGRSLPPLDGAIGIDQRFLELMLQATGSISLPGVDEMVTSENIIETIQATWAKDEDETIAEWTFNRKSFLGAFATAFLDKVQTDFGSIDPIQLVTSVFEATSTKRLQIYMRDPAVADVLNEVNWDGRLENPANQDYWMVVDTNLGFNKANLFIERRFEYQIEIDENGAAQANLSATFIHTGNKTTDICAQAWPTYEDPNYLAVASGCYWNYYRIYTPAGTTLLDSTRHTIAAEVMSREEVWDQTAEAVNDVAGWTTFANLLVVEEAAQTETALSYQLPENIIVALPEGSKQYQLQIGKQAGTSTTPVTIRINLPNNAEIVEFSPSNGVVEGNQISFDLNLLTDLSLSVTYRDE